MCGIVGYIGKQPAAPLLLHGLSRLEYRGYDSAGIALMGSDGLTVYKTAGRLQRLIDRVQDEVLPQTAGIGHTRWATHGRPDDQNAHPHLSGDGRIAVVHNGIVENHAALRSELEREGFVFRSQTDTEVIAQRLQYHYDGDPLAALRKTLDELEGSYALAVQFADHPDELYATRRASPLTVGIAGHGHFVASDIPAVLSQTRRFLSLEDGETVRVTRRGISVWDRRGNPVEKTPHTVEWSLTEAEKDGYDHFMLKEIYEQPDALRRTLAEHWRGGHTYSEPLKTAADHLARAQRMYVVACGSAYHAGVVGKYVLERLAALPVEVDLASEFRYRQPLLSPDTPVLVISQSGETADTLAALKEAKRCGAPILAIVNVPNSAIAMQSDVVLYTRAGPEIAVATTKAYSTQLAVLYLLAACTAALRGHTDKREIDALLTDLEALPERMRDVLGTAPQLRALARRYTYLEHAYFIGRHLDYAAALEASLKLKEISYIHSEAYAAGELKHGTIALIENGTLVAALACYPDTIEKTLSNVREVRARGAEVLLITTADRPLDGEADHRLVLPQVHPLLTASLTVLPLQLLGYFVALARKCDIDKPRNLAKSVTVE